MTKANQEKINRAWITFLSSNDYYIYLLLGLYKDLLDTDTKYPVYCGVTAQVNSDTRKILQAVGIKLIELDTSVFDARIIQNSQQTCQHYAAAFTKLALLDTPIENQFNKIVYIDSDTHIVENMDDLFDKPHMSAVRDNWPGTSKWETPYKLGESKFCSGLFVWDFEHNIGCGHEIIKNLVKLNLSVKWHDQSVLNFFFKDWQNHPELHIDPSYHLMNNRRNIIMMEGRYKALHFTGRIRDDWPFRKPKKLRENQWKSGNLYFKEWVESIESAIEYFKKMYNINIENVRSANLILLTKEEELQEKADGQSNTFLYF